MKVDRWQITHYGPPCVRQARRRLGAGRHRRAPGRPLQGHEHVEPERDHARDREDRALLLRPGLQLQARRAVDPRHAAPSRSTTSSSRTWRWSRRSRRTWTSAPSPAVNLGQDKAWIGDAPDRRAAGQAGTAAAARCRMKESLVRDALRRIQDIVAESTGEPLPAERREAPREPAARRDGRGAAGVGRRELLRAQRHHAARRPARLHRDHGELPGRRGARPAQPLLRHA